ncbi:MAG: RNA polymerase sigma-54 factor, partial [Erythrobacter sp.]|nr:RNA polymerase sigma-54 factor [Erythrobacter sp.]
MALSPRLDIRQTQSLVMTPQLQQAIKLLALSNLEIEAFVGEALETNPLLDIGEIAHEKGESGDDLPAPSEHESDPGPDGSEALDIESHAIDPDAARADVQADQGDWSKAASGGSLGEDSLPDLENRSSDGPSLAEHLEAQIGSEARDTREALIAQRLVGELDEAGYFTGELRAVSDDLGVPLAEVERGLALVQRLDPTGVGARDLAECLALQAREADRYDPCMARLIDNLELVAAGEVARLKRLCQVDDEDFADMLAELREYDPRPGLRFGGGAEAPVVPDVLIGAKAGGGWDIRLNADTLPQLVVNREYY